MNEALEEASEKEEEIAITPVKEVVKEEAAPVKEEVPVVEEVKKDVKTTTSLEDLEKSLQIEADKAKKQTSKKKFSNKKKEEEEEEKSTLISNENTVRMSIYTEEELREMEEEEAREQEVEEEDVDYDDYDDYYDDDDR